jgi:hypothetical protein
MCNKIQNIVKNAQVAVKGEAGGPSVETIIGICVALIIGVALIAFGRSIAKYIFGADKSVQSMQTGDLSN